MYWLRILSITIFLCMSALFGTWKEIWIWKDNEYWNLFRYILLKYLICLLIIPTFWINNNIDNVDSKTPSQIVPIKTFLKICRFKCEFWLSYLVNVLNTATFLFMTYFGLDLCKIVFNYLKFKSKLKFTTINKQTSKKHVTDFNNVEINIIKKLTDFSM